MIMEGGPRPYRVTRREFILVAARSIAAVVLAGCGSARSATPPPAIRITPSPHSGSTPVLAVTLEDKIGQMILVGFRGLEVRDSDPVALDIRERHIGGVVLFDYDVPTRNPVRNIQSPQQVRALTASLNKIARAPLLIAVDQEGGNVQRLKEKSGFPASISQQRLGDLNDPQVTRRYAETTARTLADLGINLNFAPVVDLNTNPQNPIIGGIERSFSAGPKTVIDHATQVIQAHRERGVLTTLKHFPGHGSSRADSHLGLVDVTNTWSQAELEPYASLVGAGLCDAVMTAHIFNSKLDPEWPATLSRSTITGILRERLHYDGVVISDDLQMKAIADHYGLETTIHRAIDAGVDVLAIANNSVYDERVAGRAIEIIKQLVQDGRISAARIEQSYQRIMQLKARLR